MVEHETKGDDAEQVPYVVFEDSEIGGFRFVDEASAVDVLDRVLGSVA